MNQKEEIKKLLEDILDMTANFSLDLHYSAYRVAAVVESKAKTILKLIEE